MMEHIRIEKYFEEASKKKIETESICTLQQV